LIFCEMPPASIRWYQPGFPSTYGGVAAPIQGVSSSGSMPLQCAVRAGATPIVVSVSRHGFVIAAAMCF
jgi:hypothetical protein